MMSKALFNTSLFLVILLTTLSIQAQSVSEKSHNDGAQACQHTAAFIFSSGVSEIEAIGLAGLFSKSKKKRMQAIAKMLRMIKITNLYNKAKKKPIKPINVQLAMAKIFGGAFLMYNCPPIMASGEFKRSPSGEKARLARENKFNVSNPDVNLTVDNPDDPKSCSRHVSITTKTVGLQSDVVTDFGDFPDRTFMWVKPFGTFPTLLNQGTDYIKSVMPSLGIDLDLDTIKEIIAEINPDLHVDDLIPGMCQYLNDKYEIQCHIENYVGSFFAGWRTDINSLVASGSIRKDKGQYVFPDGDTPVQFRVYTNGNISSSVKQPKTFYFSKVKIRERFFPEVAINTNETYQGKPVAAEITYEALNPNGVDRTTIPPLSNNLEVTDNCDPNPQIDIPMPDFLELGTYYFPLTVRDRSGNTVSDLFVKVVVQDTLPPDVDPPQSIGIEVPAGKSSFGFSEQISINGETRRIGCLQYGCEDLASNPGVKLYPQAMFDFATPQPQIRCQVISGGIAQDCASAQLPVGKPLTIQWEFTDLSGNSTTINQYAQLRVVNTNQKPRASDASFRIAAGSTVALPLEINDPEYDPLSYELLSAPNNGVLESENTATFQTRFSINGLIGKTASLVKLRDTSSTGDLFASAYLLADSFNQKIIWSYPDWNEFFLFDLSNVTIINGSQTLTNQSVSPDSLSSQLLDNKYYEQNLGNNTKNIDNLWLVDWQQNRLYVTRDCYVNSASSTDNCTLEQVAQLEQDNPFLDNSQGQPGVDYQPAHIMVTPLAGNPYRPVDDIQLVVTLRHRSNPLLGGLYMTRYHRSSASAPWTHDPGCSYFFPVGFNPDSIQRFDSNNDGFTDGFYLGNWQQQQFIQAYTTSYATSSCNDFTVSPVATIALDSEFQAQSQGDVANLIRPLDSMVDSSDQLLIFDDGDKELEQFQLSANTQGLYSLVRRLTPQATGGTFADIEAVIVDDKGDFTLAAKEVLGKYNLKGKLLAQGRFATGANLAFKDMDSGVQGLYFAIDDSSNTITDRLGFIGFGALTSNNYTDAINKMQSTASVANNVRSIAFNPLKKVYSPFCTDTIFCGEDDRLFFIDDAGLHAYRITLAGNIYTGGSTDHFITDSSGDLFQYDGFGKNDLLYLATDSAGNLYVSESALHRVHKYDNSYQYQGWIGACSGDGGSGLCQLEAGSSSGYTSGFCLDCVAAGAGSDNAQFSFGSGFGRLRVDRQDNVLFVADQPLIKGNRLPRVQSFDLDQNGLYTNAAYPDAQANNLSSFIEKGDFTGVRDIAIWHDSITNAQHFYIAEGAPLQRLHQFSNSVFYATNNGTSVYYNSNTSNKADGSVVRDSFSFRPYDTFEYGNVALITVDVIHDNIPPQIQCPAALTLEASHKGGVFWNGSVADDGANFQLKNWLQSATASDNIDLPAVRISHDAADTVAVGQHQITFTATDGSGLSSSCVAPLTIKDTTPPQLKPGPATVEATARLTPVSDFAPKVSDIASSMVSLKYNVADALPLGTHTITWTASDQHQNTTRLTQTIEIVDTTAPVFDQTASQLNTSVQAENGYAIASNASYQITATDQVELYQITCQPGENDFFDSTLVAFEADSKDDRYQVPVWNMDVRCTAYDSSDNRSNINFISQVVFGDDNGNGVFDKIDMQHPDFFPPGSPTPSFLPGYYFSDEKLGGLTQGRIEGNSQNQKITIVDAPEKNQGVRLFFSEYARTQGLVPPGEPIPDYDPPYTDVNIELCDANGFRLIQKSTEGMSYTMDVIATCHVDGKPGQHAVAVNQGHFAVEKRMADGKTLYIDDLSDRDLVYFDSQWLQLDSYNTRAINITHGGQSITLQPGDSYQVVSGVSLNPGKVGFVQSSYQVDEGGRLSIQLERSGGSDGELRVDYSVVNMLANDDAQEQDFSGSMSGSLVWADGETGIKTLEYQTYSDTKEEIDEQFRVDIDTHQVTSDSLLQVSLVQRAFITEDSTSVTIIDQSAATGTSTTTGNGSSTTEGGNTPTDSQTATGGEATDPGDNTDISTDPGNDSDNGNKTDNENEDSIDTDNTSDEADKQDSTPTEDTDKESGNDNSHDNTANDANNGSDTDNQKPEDSNTEANDLGSQIEELISDQTSQLIVITDEGEQVINLDKKIPGIAQSPVESLQKSFAPNQLNINIDDDYRLVVSDDEQQQKYVAKPVSVRRSQQQTTPGIHISTNGSLKLVTQDGYEITLLATLDDRKGFESLFSNSGVQISYDNFGAIMIKPQQRKEAVAYIYARPAFTTTRIAASSRLQQNSIQSQNWQQGSLPLYYYVYNDNGIWRRQDLYPFPIQWDSALPDLIETYEISNIELDVDGSFSFDMDGKRHKARFGYEILPSSKAKSRTYAEAVGDQDGNGKKDFYIHYPSGYKQLLYQL